MEKGYINIEGDLTLDDLLERNELTLKEFAGKLGVDTSTIWKWRNRKTSITAKYILKACPILKVSAKTFLGSLGYDISDMPDDEPVKIIKQYRFYSSIDKNQDIDYNQGQD
jgi:transcriptional regulator with XRE-family HTH domain